MGELQHKLLEALFTLNCDEESIAEGEWFLIPDNSTRILEKYESSAHPGFIPDGGLTDPYGIVYVWSTVLWQCFNLLWRETLTHLTKRFGWVIVCTSSSL